MADAKWNSESPPLDDAVVYVLAEDKRGQYELPFPVVFRGDCWWNADTGDELDVYIAGWRPLE